MKLLISLLLLLISTTNAAVDRDWSFKDMCKFWGGKDTYKQRESYNAMEGDKCTFKFPMATETEESARTYCEEYVPYHIITAVPGSPTTECRAEATLICHSGWVQMFGRCYRMVKQMMTKDEGKARCEKERKGSKIGFMHREALPFRIADYYTAVYQYWIDASEAITGNLIYDVPGGNLLIANDGYPYSLPNIALARVDKSTKAMVLCEYTPEMTQSESNWLLEKYGQIYYPTVRTSEGSYVRTASSLNRNENDNTADNKYCERVMKPFVPGGMAQSAFPTKEFMNKVQEANKNDRSLIVRTSAFSKNSKKSERQKKTCVRRTAGDFHMFLTGSNGQAIPKTIDQSSWKESSRKEECDAASWSSSIVLSHGGSPGLELMSDARYAPIYCQSITDTYKYGACPSGFLAYDRKSTGQRWCHKFVTDKKNYWDAQANCEAMGSHVSGYTEHAELDFLDDIMTKSGLPFNHGDDTWLGAERRAQCVKTGDVDKPGFEADPSSPCSRVNVFQWVNEVAPNPPIFDTWMSEKEPNYLGQNEVCVTLIKGSSMYWGGSSVVAKGLNDIKCSNKYYFFCGVEAPIVKA
ncbi:unnamed protein product [Caenorhabditis brenneri]